MRLLVARFEQTAIWNSNLPQISPEDSETFARHLCAIALSGLSFPYGSTAAIQHGLDGVLRHLGAEHLSELVGVGEGTLRDAAWVYLRAIPHQSAKDNARTIARCARALAMCHNGLPSVAERDADGVRKFINAIVLDDPVPALGMMLALGRDDCRPVPSGGASQLLCNIGAVDWQEGLLGGWQSIRRAAHRYLKDKPPTIFFATEDWGFRDCPDNCRQCCLIDHCTVLKMGAI